MGQRSAQWYRVVRQRRMQIVAGIGLALLMCVSARAAPPPLDTQIEGVYAYRLPNGLQVLLVPDGAKPTLTIHLTLGVGSRDEGYGERGAAHLLEHLMFQSLPETPAPRARFASRGIRANASTSHDRTLFSASFAADEANARWYLRWLSQALALATPGAAAVKAELPAIRNEMDIAESNGPGMLQQRTLAAMYEWHAYGHSPYGVRSDLERVDPRLLAAFRSRYYRPDNATLIVAGAFERQAMLSTVSARFGALARPAATLPARHTLESAQDGERQLRLRRPGGAPMVMVGFHAPAGPERDFAVLELLVQAMTREPDGLLYRRLVSTGSVARVFGFARAQADPGAFFFGVQPGPGQDAEAARAALLAAVSTAPDFSQQDLERARAGWLAEWRRNFADAERIGARLAEAVGHGDWRLFFLRRDQVGSVTLADLGRVAGAWMRADNRTVATLVAADEAGRAPAPQATDLARLMRDFKGVSLTAQPAGATLTPARLDASAQRYTLPGGATVALLPKANRGGQVEARLTLALGDAHSLAGQTQVAGLLANVMRKGGLAGLDRYALEAELDRLQASLHIGFFRQELIVDMRATGEHLPALIALAVRLVMTPALPEAVLGEERARWLADLERSGRDPAVRLDELIGRHGSPYPAGDVRYVATIEEEAAAIRAVTLDQLRDFQRRFVLAGAAGFAAAGDFDVDATRSALAAALGRAPTPAASPAIRALRIADRRDPPPATTLAWRTPGLKNATVVLNLMLPLRDDDANAPALRLADRMFGQVGSGRLWRRLRERDGLSYGAWSETTWNSYDPVSWWRTTVTFAPHDRPRVDAALREELARSLATGFTAAELDAARTGLLNERRLALAQDRPLARKLLEQASTGRTFASDARFDRALAAASLAEVNAAWRRFVEPARLVWAWAGDFDVP